MKPGVIWPRSRDLSYGVFHRVHLLFGRLTLWTKVVTSKFRCLPGQMTFWSEDAQPRRLVRLRHNVHKHHFQDKAVTMYEEPYDLHFGVDKPLSLAAFSLFRLKPLI